MVFVRHKEKARNKVMLSLVGVWVILIGIHLYRFTVMYTQTDMRDFPFPLIVYPLMICVTALSYVERKLRKSAKDNC